MPMKKTMIMFVFFVVLFTASLMIESETQSSVTNNGLEPVFSGEKEISVYFFYGDGCSHCDRVKPFIAQMEHEHSLAIYQYEIYHHMDNIVLLNQYFDTNAVPTERRGIPALFVSDSYLVGDEPILSRFEEVITEVLKEDSMVVHTSDFEVNTSQDLAEEGACSESEGKSNCLSILTVTIAALVDSVSPCSLAVLLFLVGVRPLVTNRRKRALKIGLAFSFSVFLTYTLFGLGLLSVIRISGLSSMFGVAAGLVAIFAGIFYVKDYFWRGAGGFVMEVPRSLRPVINRMIKSVTSPVGAFLMGFVICCFELPCTGGPYLFILGQLANASTRLQTIPMLLYYNFLFITPLLLISLFLYFGRFSLKKATEWNNSNKGLLHLASGLTIISLGILVIPSSQLIWLVRTFLGCCKVVLPPVLFTLSFYLVFSFLRVHQMRAKLFAKAILLASLPVISIFAYPQLLKNVEMNVAANVGDTDIEFDVSNFPSMRAPVTHSRDAYYETFRGSGDFAYERLDDLVRTRRDFILEPEKTIPLTAEELARIEESLQTEHKIRLKSRSFVPEKGVDSALLDSMAAKLGHERIHVIIQFVDIPNEDERQALEKNNVTILNYVPEYAYIASLTSAAVENIANLPDVRAIVPILPEDKISSHIKNNEFGVWALFPNNMVYVFIEFFEDVSLDDAEMLVQSYNGQIIGRISAVNALSVFLPIDQINAIANEDIVAWIQQATPPFSEGNDGARAALNVNTVQAPPYNLNGSGVTVFVYDGGLVDDTHDDFGTRVTHGEVGTLKDHATHCAGTCCGAGTLSGGRLRGMSTNASIYSRFFECDPYCFYNSTDGMQVDFQAAINHGVDLATLSIISNIYKNNYPCSWEGDYELSSQLYDQIITGSLGQRIISIQCSGNERSRNAPCGHYGTIPQPTTGKNNIAVGATNTNDKSMTDFSSWGPTDDGRLKPDVVGPGCQVGGDEGINSTVVDDSYDVMCGCSMATPAVAGTVGLMLEEMRTLRGDPNYLAWPSTIKAILVQTAIDLNNTGPDYTTGYGHVDAKEAIDLIIRDDDLGNELIRQGNVVDNEIDTYLIYVPPGLPELKVTLAWDDPAAAPLSGDDLVNDLDLYLSSPSGINYYAYMLDPANPNDPATTGWNFRDNLEQVVVSNPEQGIWQVKVWGWVVTGTQSYSVVFPYEQIQCGGYIYEDVTLTTDYTCTGTAFRIGNSGITIDCNGHTLQGSGTGYGIENTRNYVTIKNCTIIDFDYGIYMHDIADNNHLLNNDVISNDNHGIYLNDAWRNEIRDNYVYLNGLSGGNGLYLYDSKYNDVLHNEFELNFWHGIQLKGTSNINTVEGNLLRLHSWSGMGIDADSNVIRNNNASSNTYHGFHLASTQGNILDDNRVENNGEKGIYVYNSTGTQIIDNYAYANGEDGVYLDHSNYTTITHSDFVQNTNNGVYLYNADHNTVQQSDFYQNYADGVKATYSKSNIISYNDVRMSTDQGLDIRFSSDNTISFNNITENGDYGIYLFQGDHNNLLNNFLKDNDVNGFEILMDSSDDNDISNNVINHGTSSGIYSSTSDNIQFYNNTVCGYSWDFYTASSTYNADENTCDLAYQFVDSGQPDACDFKCSGCRRPEADTYIYEDTTLCPGTYNIPDTGSSGVLIVQIDSLTLDCNGAVLIGGDSGFGILVNGLDGITINNCTIQNYSYGLRLIESIGSQILDNEFTNNSQAGIFLHYSNSCVVDSNLAYSNLYGIYLYSPSTDNYVQFNDAIENDYGIYIIGDQNYVHNNIVEKSTNIGVLFASAANNNELNNNIICANSLDINDMDSNSGDNNYCDTTSNWNDDGTTGCTSVCLPPDVAVLGAGPARMRIPDPFFGTTMPVVAVVENQGMKTQTFDVSIFYDTTLIGTSTVTLDAGATETVSFDWDLGALPNGVYTISANASVVPEETDTTDNCFIGGEVRKTFDGDVNADGIVDAYDLFDLSKAYESTTLSEDINSDGIVNYADYGLWMIAFGSEPGAPNWNPYADLDNNEIINVNDGTLLIFAFGETGSPNWNPYADMNADNEVGASDLTVLSQNYGRTS